MPRLWHATLDGVTEVEVEHEPDQDVPHGRAYWVADLDIVTLKGVHLFDTKAEAEMAAAEMDEAEMLRRAVLASQEVPE